MRTIKFIYFLFILLLFYGAEIPSETISCRDIIHQMFDSIKNIKSEQFDVKATERIDDVLHFADSRIKIIFNPHKIYFYSPKKGTEILWVEGTNKGNAIVHSKTLPFVNFDLDPLGNIMRKDQHHTIFDLGTPFIATTIANTIIKAPKDFDKHFKYAGIIKWNNTDCYQIIIEYPEYKYIEYITTKGETVTTISQKFNTSDYKIRNINDLSSYFGTIKEGKKISIPIPYSNKVIVYIDKQTFIPINVMVYDEKGLFEQYEFYNLKINPVFETDEFSKHYKGYSF